MVSGETELEWPWSIIQKAAKNVVLKAERLHESLGTLRAMIPPSSLAKPQGVFISSNRRLRIFLLSK